MLEDFWIQLFHQLLDINWHKKSVRVSRLYRPLNTAIFYSTLLERSIHICEEQVQTEVLIL